MRLNVGEGDVEGGPGWKEEGSSGVGGTREGDGDKCD